MFFRHSVVIRKSHLHYMLNLKFFWRHWHNGNSMWLFESSVAHLCSNTVAVEPGFSPAPRYSVCLLDLASTSDLQHEYALHQEYRTCHCLSGPCMRFQPGIPKIKHIIITDANHPNQDGREEKMRYSSHIKSKVFFGLCWICLIPLPVSLLGSQQWGGLLFFQFCCCVYCNTQPPLPLLAAIQHWSAAPHYPFQIIIRNHSVDILLQL